MKKQRQKAIISLISQRVIDTQEDLQTALQELGFAVTQATVSRDIKELRIVKALDSNGVYRYISNSQSEKAGISVKYREIFSHSVESVDYAMNNIVLKCHPGMAQGACAAFDKIYSDEVLGSLAGDDTILVITHTESQAKELCEELLKILV